MREGRLTNSLAAFCTEPIYALRLAYLIRKGLPCLENVNPSVLTGAQQEEAPIGLLHGDYCGEGSWTPLVQAISQMWPHRPLFTFALTSKDGAFSEERHTDAVLERLEAIRALYPKKPRPIILIGHSSGGNLIGHLKVKQLSESAEVLDFVGAVIKIGSVYPSEIAKRFAGRPDVVEIIGTHDIFVRGVSHLPQAMSVKTGHLGLLFHPEVHECVLNRIK